MYKSKQLEWYPHEDDLNGIYAQPDIIKWSYSILVHKDGQIQLGILDNNYEYMPGFPEICSSITDAKHKAATHYTDSINQLIEQT